MKVFTFVEVDDAAGRLLGDVMAMTSLFDAPGAATLGSNVPGTSTACEELIGNVIMRMPTYGNSVNNRLADDGNYTCDNGKEKGKQRDESKTVRQSSKVRTRVADADGSRDTRRAPIKLSRKYRSPVEVKRADSNSVIDGVQGASPDLDASPFGVHEDGRCSPDTAIHERNSRKGEGSCRELGRANRHGNGVESTCYVKRAAFTDRNNLTPASLYNGVCASKTGSTSVNSLDQLVKLTEQPDTSLTRKIPVCPATPTGEKTHKTSASNPGQRRRSVSASSCCHSNVADDASTSDDPALPVLEKHEIECETEPPTPNSQPRRADSGVYDDSEMPELICCAY